MIYPCSYLSRWPETAYATHLFSLALMLCAAFAQSRDIGATGGDETSAGGETALGDAVIRGLSEVSGDGGSLDLSELLPAEVQKALPKVFAHYGHPEAFVDDETGSFLHKLLPQLRPDLDDMGATNKAWIERPQNSEFNNSLLEHLTNIAEQQHEATDVHQRGEATEALRRKQEEQAVVADQRRAEFEASRRRQEELMQRLSEQKKAAAQRQSRMRTHNAQMNARVEQLLKQAHEQIAADTHGFRDAPFWDDFFGNATTRQQWSLLSMEALQPALEAAMLLPQHRVLVLEPSASFGLAGRLAHALLERGFASTAGHAYGAEPDEGVDMVLELGLLDAMAMGGGGELDGRSRLAELRRAAGRVSNLLQPNGCWVSVSSVPPALRLPLLERLAGGTFKLPEVAANGLPSVAAESPAGTHTIVLDAADPEALPEAKRAPKLRGSLPGGLETGAIANLLLYGHRAPRVFAYRMSRVVDAWMSAALKDTEQGSLESIIAAQQEDIRDDL